MELILNYQMEKIADRFQRRVRRRIRYFKGERISKLLFHITQINLGCVWYAKFKVLVMESVNQSITICLV